MRMTMLALGLMVAGPAGAQAHKLVHSAPASTAPLKPFEFRGFVAGQEMTPEQRTTCHTVMESTFCGPNDSKVAGVSTQQVYVSAQNWRMVSVGILADPIFFGVLTDAFKAKYGPPCRSSAPMWVGELGNKRPNPTMVWCFKTGKLTAKMYGALLTSSEINYADASEVPLTPQKPKVDF